jgi:hypothetical protein
MRIFGITKTGLRAIALAVLCLWTCLGLEAIARSRANRDAKIALLQIESLRHKAVPVSLPAPVNPPASRPFHSNRPLVS